MKKIILTAAATSIMFLTYSQEIGIKAGFNLSNQNQNPFDRKGDYSNNLPGYQVGIASNFKINEHLSFSPSVEWITKGNQIKYDIWFTDMQNNKLFFVQNQKQVSKLEYLELPMLFTYKFNTGKIKPFVQAGPYVSFIFNIIEEQYYHDQLYSKKVKHRDDYNPLDFGINAGVGVEISKFQFIANYDYGLTNVLKEPTSEIKNRSMQFSGIFFFNKK